MPPALFLKGSFYMYHELVFQKRSLAEVAKQWDLKEDVVAATVLAYVGEAGLPVTEELEFLIRVAR